MHHQTWKKSLGRFARKTGEAIVNLLKADLTETKIGHRIMDQIFREGKFTPKDCNGADSGKRDD